MVKEIFKLRCINNAPFSPDQLIQNLTIGKIYETFDDPYKYSSFLVVNDIGDEIQYLSSRFEVVTLQQLREDKLRNLGI